MKKKAPQKEPEGITGITVSGFKSISRERSIEIRPLTILAGANSSGKSSIMQPLLLLKQTLEEERYVPDVLKLDGPNVKFISADQFFSKTSKGKVVNTFYIGIMAGHHATLTIHFYRHPVERGLDIKRMDFADGKKAYSLHPGMKHDEILVAILSYHRDWYETFSKRERSALRFYIGRSRCFLQVEAAFGSKSYMISPYESYKSFIDPIDHLIHVSGLRGNPERVYHVAGVDLKNLKFPGIFERYVASIIMEWQKEGLRDKLEKLGKELWGLGLTWRVVARPINDTQVELRVGRLPRATRDGARDVVNIADVGFGVSQALPVLIALQVAEPGQTVYLEQPELHLHPRAQYAMAEVLADAANRGVRVIAETHSSLLLLGVQSLVAEGRLSPEKVKLHWFKRGKDGSTEVTGADLDEAGAFGDWPEDFADVSLKAESRYLDAAGARLKGR